MDPPEETAAVRRDAALLLLTDFMGFSGVQTFPCFPRTSARMRLPQLEHSSISTSSSACSGGPWAGGCPKPGPAAGEEGGPDAPPPPNVGFEAGCDPGPAPPSFPLIPPAAAAAPRPVTLFMGVVAVQAFWCRTRASGCIVRPQ